LLYLDFPAGDVAARRIIAMPYLMQVAALLVAALTNFTTEI
jgi:hypothetical protein